MDKPPPLFNSISEETTPRCAFPQDTSETSIHWNAPAPIAYSVVEMLREPTFNSADELVYALESCLRHLGWLWLVEYLTHTEHDPDVDRILFRFLLEGKRELSVGTWAYLGSLLSHLFHKNKWTLKFPSLAEFSYGDPADEQSPLSQLLRYRNHFAHGSFDTQLSEILLHRSLYWSLLEPMQALWKQSPLVFWDPEASSVREANGHWSLRPDLALPEPKPYELYALRQEQEPLSLAPMFQVRRTKTNETQHHIYSHIHELSPWHLRTFDLRKSSTSARLALFQRNPSIQAHLTTHEQTLQGILPFQNTWNKTTWPKAQREALQPLQRMLLHDLLKRANKRPNVVCVEGYPGSGKTHLLATVEEWAVGFDSIFRYRLTPGHLTQSPTTFLRYVLRKLNPEDEELAHLSHKKLEDLWHQTLEQWEQQEQRVLFALDQFQFAHQPYQDETLSLNDWLSQQRGQATARLSVLLTLRPGYHDPFGYDALRSLPIVDTPLPDTFVTMMEELGWLEQAFPTPETPSRHPEERRLGRALLYLLAKTENSMTSMELRQPLKQLLDRLPQLLPAYMLLTPRISHTLRELRPFLRWSREETTSIHDAYTPFSVSLRQWLLQTLQGEFQ
ncbi:MAG: ATP-binding protein [Deltaproteobacteria bacterium]|nr:MAG: ATP-binding protein [Deltaproteobacteria bacterium]